VNLDDLELELRKLPGVRAAGFSEREDVLLIQLQVSGESSPANLPLQATRIAYRHSEKPVALEVVRWRVSPEPRDHAAVGTSPLEGALGSLAGVDPLPVATDRAVETDVSVPETGAPATTAPTITAVAEPPAPPPPPAPAPAPAPAPEPEPEPMPVPELVPPAPLAEQRTESGDRRVRLLAVLTFPDTDELEVHLTFEGRRIIGRAVASNGILGVVEAMVDGLKVFVPRLEFTPSWARVLNDDGRDAHVVACELLAPDDSRRLGIASGASAIEAAARATLHALNRAVARQLVEDAEPATAE
jgi:hypothetical protein